MGYYVTLNSTNAYIPNDKLDEAYTILCALNQDNSLKRGGRWPRTEQDGPHSGVWFSWMDWDYPETCKDAAAIIAQLGFEFTEDGDGLWFYAYDNKTGAEDVFLAALAPVLASSDDEAPQFVWQGEDGAAWRQIVIDGVMQSQSGRLTFG